MRGENLIRTITLNVIFVTIESKAFWKMRFPEREGRLLINSCGNEDEMNLDNMNLTRISLTASHPNEIKYLSARHNLLEKIKLKEIEKFPKLVCLDASYNSIPPQRLLFGGVNRNLKKIILHNQRTSRDCLREKNQTCTDLGQLETYLPSLEYLNIAKCHINHISSYFHFMFPNLKWIDLSHNRINGIQELLNQVTSTLTHVFMSKMGIKKLDIFNLKNVRVLVLDRNVFSSLGKNSTKEYLILRNMDNLRYLSLRYCLIKTIHNFAFDAAPNLRDLDLSHNYITTLNANAIAIPNLERLLLNNNFLLTFPKKTGLIKLRVLSLSNNELWQFPKSLNELQSLESLLLKGNKIPRIRGNALRSLTKLKLLHLGRNKLKKLPAGWMNAMTQLQYLNIDNNKFDSLEDIAMNKSSNLKLLFMSGGSFIGIDFKKFIQFFPSGVIVIYTPVPNGKTIVRVGDESTVITVYNHDVVII